MPRTNKEIVESEAFRAINLLLAQKVQSLLFWQETAKLRMDMLLNGKHQYGSEEQVTIRVHEEGNQEVQLPFNMNYLKDIREIIESAEKDKAVIAELTQFKLRLLNDYDFTHGDSAEQIIVFGESPNK